MWPFSSRTKRVDVGTYRRPDRQPLPSVDSQVDEGLLIVESGVRLAVKNQAILWVLRDGDDFDHLRYLEATRRELIAAADEAADDAVRISEQLDEVAASSRSREAEDSGRRERRIDVLQGLVERIGALVDDESFLAGLALQARDAAWDEIGAAVIASALLAAPSTIPVTWDERDQALAQVRFDLEELEARQHEY